MMTDYKITSTSEDRGILTVNIRMYEGDVTTENEIVNGKSVPVTRYRRTKVLGSKSYTIETGESGSRQALELHQKLMRKDLGKDRTRTTIPEQKDV